MRSILVATGLVTTFAGSLSGSPGTADGQGTSAAFNGPHGLATDAAGLVLLVTEDNSHRIRRVDIASGVTTLLAGNSASVGPSDGLGSLALFNTPRWIAVNAAGSFAIVVSY